MCVWRRVAASTSPEMRGDDNRPVINVSWDDDTKEYLPWLSRKAGKQS
jgi:formylglycine-generating enzyme required for sulfatase activity